MLAVQAERAYGAGYETEEDLVWAEHQEWERYRRANPPQPRPKPQPFDIRPVLAAVLADFARWEAERNSGKQGD